MGPEAIGFFIASLFVGRPLCLQKIRWNNFKSTEDFIIMFSDLSIRAFLGVYTSHLFLAKNVLCNHIQRQYTQGEIYAISRFLFEHYLINLIRLILLKTNLDVLWEVTDVKG